MPDLCDFSFTSTHRFESSESKTPLQIGVTTNGQGCRLAGRIRREIVARLPPEAGAAVQTVGRLREMVRNTTTTSDRSPVKDEVSDDNEDSNLPTPNLPVSLRRVSDGNEAAFDRDKRRMKWVAQISEYWPLSRLAQMSTEEMEDVLNSDVGSPSPPSSSLSLPSIHTLLISPPKRTGRILLVGSGPGHPALLTRATHSALTEHAQLVLSDKLVPAAVLALIPAHVEVRIARKFPGNADGAQHELMLAAVDAARRGLTVVRVRLSLSLHTFTLS
jgi:uroporphyrin-III C-methyltransferase